MNILLVCAAGASTSIVVESIKKNLKEEEQNWFVEAKSIHDVGESIGKYDVILVAPQIRYQKSVVEEMAESFENIVILDINPIHYGTCNGKEILNSVRKNIV